MNISKTMNSEKVPNMRDLGGMMGADGKKIRKRMLIRSEQLVNASDKDKDMLQGLPLRKIFDFRNSKEAVEKPDPTLDGCEYFNLSIIDESTLISWESDKKETDLQSGIEGMCEIYRNFVRMEYSRKQYSRFLHEIMETEDGAVLWHCTLGKDRCGFGTLLVEAVMGVAPEDIMEDYLYTNECLKDEIAGMMEMLRNMTKNTNLKDAGNYLVEARPEYLQAAWDEIDKLYGSMEAFLEQGLGIDGAMITRFRERYLE